MIKHYVTFYFPGAFVAETEEQQIYASDNIHTIRIPKGAYAFTLFAREITQTQHNGKTITLTSEELDPVSYTIGTFYSKEQIEKEFGRDSILFGNVEDNGWLGAVKTRMGNFTSVRDEAEKECIIDPSKINEEGFIEPEKPKVESPKEEAQKGAHPSVLGQILESKDNPDEDFNNFISKVCKSKNKDDGKGK